MGNNLETHIRRQRLRWLGHVSRMESAVLGKSLNSPDGARLRGRFRTGWWTCVQTDLVRLGIRNWRWQNIEEDGGG
ncbi:hypothetical protein C0J52_14434 [Blattella germanica]|nr:hypothetical protein C0J52_14434 [Blattella germanica]